MLKTIRLSNKPAFDRNNNNKSAFNRNNNRKPAFRKNNNDNEVNKYDIGRNSIKYTKKSRKLFKSEKSKSKKIFKSQNLAKLKKKLSKNRN